MSDFYKCSVCLELFVNNSLYIEHTKVCEISTPGESNVVAFKENTQPSSIKYIDLFCGLGAFHTAFNMLSDDSTHHKTYECVFACDISENAKKLYYENYNIIPAGDICLIKPEDIPAYGILCAGFPCTSFSIAGKKEGFNHITKGNLFYEVMRIVDATYPNTIILENVRNLMAINKGEVFNIMKKELEQRGYSVSYKCIDSKLCGSPQSRKRVYLVCHLVNSPVGVITNNKPYVFTELNEQIHLTPVSQILDNTYAEFLDYSKKYTLVVIPRLKMTSPQLTHHLFNIKTGKGGRQGERVYSIDTAGPTICASSGGPGAKTGLYMINDQIRRLNVREAFQMFGFSVDYKRTSVPNDNDMLFHLGNSIVVDVLLYIIRAI
jgi:DNA (cytosine-5)-methyltransferase 1